MPGFSDYQKEIINAYQTLKKTGRLASELENPSPAQLRDYCLKIWARRFEKADASVIKSFFDPDNKYDNLEIAIRKSEIDKLRPLIKFMTKGGQTRDDNNVKLLAWLIDFRPRPYKTWFDQQQNSEETGPNNPQKPDTQNDGHSGSGNSAPENLPPTEPPGIGRSNKIKTNIKGTVMLSFIVFASMIGVHWFGNHDEHQCMHWSDDRYQSVGCKDETIRAGITKIALDNHRLHTFRRITQPDTLTYDDIDKVWYTSITRDSLDFFTGPGKHPVHTQKYLKPVTRYILDKYVYARKTSP